jgi:S-phase kinase-associated protein 1
MAEFKENYDEQVEVPVPKKMLKLSSFDNETFQISADAGKLSVIVSNMIDEDEADEVGFQEIPLPNIDGVCLAKVVNFCNHHLEEPMTEFEKVISPSL